MFSICVPAHFTVADLAAEFTGVSPWGNTGILGSQVLFAGSKIKIFYRPQQAAYAYGIFDLLTIRDLSLLRDSRKPETLLYR
jgi:hypothetical protein